MSLSLVVDALFSTGVHLAESVASVKEILHLLEDLVQATTGSHSQRNGKKDLLEQQSTKAKSFESIEI